MLVSSHARRLDGSAVICIYVNYYVLYVCTICMRRGHLWGGGRSPPHPSTHKQGGGDDCGDDDAENVLPAQKGPSPRRPKYGQSHSGQPLTLTLPYTHTNHVGPAPAHRSKGSGKIFMHSVLKSVVVVLGRVWHIFPPKSSPNSSLTPHFYRQMPTLRGLDDTGIGPATRRGSHRL